MKNLILFILLIARTHLALAQSVTIDPRNSANKIIDDGRAEFSTVSNIVGNIYNGSNEATVNLDIDDYIECKLFINPNILEGYQTYFLTTNLNTDQRDTYNLSFNSSAIYEIKHEVRKGISISDNYIQYKLDDLDNFNVKGTIVVYGIK